MGEIMNENSINFTEAILDNFIEDIKIEMQKRAIYFQDKDEQKDFYTALSKLQKTYKKKIRKGKVND